MNARQRRYQKRHPTLEMIMREAIREEIDREILERIAAALRSKDIQK